MFARLAIADRAVCTSGNYFRFTEIDGKRYSHILDPRTGAVADAASSVTVVAPEAVLADAWATALSVLGPAGIRRLPPGGHIEAMIIVGGPDDHTVHMTPGFRPLVIPEKEDAGGRKWRPVIVRPAATRPAATRPATAPARAGGG